MSNYTPYTNVKTKRLHKTQTNTNFNCCHNNFYTNTYNCTKHRTSWPNSRFNQWLKLTTPQLIYLARSSTAPMHNSMGYSISIPSALDTSSIDKI
jgi:hypothetical protein